MNDDKLVRKAIEQSLLHQQLSFELGQLLATIKIVVLSIFLTQIGSVDGMYLRGWVLVLSAAILFLSVAMLYNFKTQHNSGFAYYNNFLQGKLRDTDHEKMGKKIDGLMKNFWDIDHLANVLLFVVIAITVYNLLIL